MPPPVGSLPRPVFLEDLPPQPPSAGCPANYMTKDHLKDKAAAKKATADEAAAEEAAAKKAGERAAAHRAAAMKAAAEEVADIVGGQFGEVQTR